MGGPGSGRKADPVKKIMGFMQPAGTDSDAMAYLPNYSGVKKDVVKGSVNRLTSSTNAYAYLDWDTGKITHEEANADELIMSIDWNARALMLGTGIEVLNWGSGQIKDGNDVLAIDWGSRTLNDSGGNTVITWDGEDNLIQMNGDLLIGTSSANIVNFRAGAGASAPPTTAGVTFTSRYGGNTKACGDPDAWLGIQVGGTDYRVPLYLAP